MTDKIMCITCGVREVVAGTTLCRACGFVADQKTKPKPSKERIR